MLMHPLGITYHYTPTNPILFVSQDCKWNPELTDETHIGTMRRGYFLTFSPILKAYFVNCADNHGFIAIQKTFIYSRPGNASRWKELFESWTLIPQESAFRSAIEWMETQIPERYNELLPLSREMVSSAIPVKIDGMVTSITSLEQTELSKVSSIVDLRSPVGAPPSNVKVVTLNRMLEQHIRWADKYHIDVEYVDPKYIHI
jgi:hypothetical protein